MTSIDPLLKTQQLAEALGVGVSTVKRWIDGGSLKSSRTVGKHRLVSLAEAIRFARTRNLPLLSLQTMQGLGAPAIAVVDDRVREALTAALRDGRMGEAKLLITSAYTALGNASQLADDVIRPAMETIGHEWSTGALDVYQEHRASRIVEGVLMDLVGKYLHSSGDHGAPLAIGACPEGDLYTLSGLLCELSLREMGWNVINLGPNLPLSSFAKAVKVHSPQLAWLSITHLTDRERFIREYRAFHEVATQTKTAVCLGGSALDSPLRARIVAGGFGERVAHLAEFARNVCPIDLESRQLRITEMDPTNPELRI